MEEENSTKVSTDQNVDQEKTTESSAAVDTSSAQENAAETTDTNTGSNEKSEAEPAEKEDDKEKQVEATEEAAEEKPDESGASNEEKAKCRVVIVTGASAGIGLEVARSFCEGGNDVIFACRNEEKANRVIQKIKAQNPKALATFMQLDLADTASIQNFVDDFHKSEKKLDILINNAGISLNFKDSTRKYTANNFELTMGTNYFGLFMLTNLLLQDLKSSAAESGESRIINVSSHIHDPDTIKRKTRQTKDLKPLDLDDLMLFNANAYNGLQAYKNSKVAGLMFTYELSRRLEGSNVTVNAVCPGFVPTTDLLRSASGTQKFFLRYILHGMLRFTKITRTVQQASSAICNLALDEKYKEVSGKYFRDGVESTSSEETQNVDNQKKLWDLSGGYCKMEGFEPIECSPPPEPEPEPEQKAEKEKAPEENTEKNEQVEKTDEEKNAEDQTEAPTTDASEDKDLKISEKKEGEEDENKTEEVAAN